MDIKKIFKWIYDENTPMWHVFVAVSLYSLIFVLPQLVLQLPHWWLAVVALVSTVWIYPLHEYSQYLAGKGYGKAAWVMPTVALIVVFLMDVIR